MTKIVNYPYLSSFSQGFTDMVEICRKNKDQEMCGIVGGRIGQIFECIFVPNIHPEPGNAYSMNSVEMSKALDELDKLGYELIALFHSHPNGSSSPSSIDLHNKALDVPMIIVSQKEVKAWRFKEDMSFDEVKLALYNPPPKISTGPLKALNTDGIRLTIEVSGKVFEELPEIFKSYFGSRNGGNFEDRMRDVQNLLQLTMMSQRGVRAGDDPDAHMGALLQNPRTREQLQVAIDNQINSQPIIQDYLNRSGIEANPGITGTGTLAPNPFPPEPTRPAPHTHRYRQISKDGEGRNIYECTFEHCDKSLTIDGDLEDKESLKGPQTEYTIKEGDVSGEPNTGQDTNR